MRKLSTFLALFLIWAFNLSSAEQLIWPLKIDRELTSKFCDYRAGHFHSGLDIRTQGRIGLPVYAVGDGYVFRVATSFRGYGKALYLKLTNGQIVVYGHLSDFFDTVNERVRATQLDSKKYTQDLYFKSTDFPVKKGQLVAYSGSTGTGAPHLHFEVRSAQNNPINPLKSGFTIADKSAPIFEYLAVKYYPTNTNSNAIPGTPCETEFLPVKKSVKPNEFIIEDTLIAGGPLALAVSGGDHIFGRGYLYSYFGLKMTLDESLIFRMESDSLSYSTTRQLNHIRDMELIRLFASRDKSDNDANIFFRLYIPPGSRQYFYDSFDSGAGIIEAGFDGSTREITIIAYDEYGNSSKLVAYVKTPDYSRESAKVTDCSQAEDSLSIIFNSEVAINKIVVQGRGKTDEPFQNRKYRRIQPIEIKSDKSKTGFRIKSSSASMIRFRYLDIDGRTSDWKYLANNDKPQKLRIYGTPELLKLEFQANGNYSGISVSLDDSRQILTQELEPSGPQTYQAEIKESLMDGVIVLTIMGDGNVIVDTSMTLRSVYPGRAAEIQSPDSSLQLSFKENSAYYPAYVFISGPIRSSLKVGPGIVYDIQPDIFLADESLKLTFNIARLALTSEKISAYGYSYTSGGWSFIGKARGTIIEASALGLGKVALIEDPDAPLISSVLPSKSTKSRQPNLSCLISDDISGLALDDGISMSLDGIWVPAEYDIDSGKFSYKVRNPLKAGIHLLEISASDNQGNTAVKSVTFTVLGQ